MGPNPEFLLNSRANSQAAKLRHGVRVSENRLEQDAEKSGLGCSSASLSGCCGTGGIGAAGDRTGFIEPI